LPVQLPESVERPLRLVKVDFEPEHRQPAAGLVLAATVVALAGSLLADALLAKAGQAMFPATKGYSHFHFSDYAKLTVIGVIIACVAWPIVTRISSDPRWLFFRQAIAVTLVLWLPDLWILYKGQPGDAVAVLMVMHVAIALVTYNALVHIAKVRPAGVPGRHGAHTGRRGRETEDEDYGYPDYGRDGYGRQDYGDQNYGDQNYGRQNYGRQDYGHQDYGRDDYFPGDREPASRQYGASYAEPDDRYEASYRQPGERRFGARAAGPDDDPYEAYFRKPADPYEDRSR
jgi:hypothetical protein